MQGDLILLLGIANIPLYKTIYETFFQETMRRDDPKNRDASSTQITRIKSIGKRDERLSLFILLCVLAVMFEFFIIEGTISIFTV
ncbi:hypothetical protein [Clostridium sp. C8-1-8]|uniref:hypothetical protein n=1 Tax=Clostridium sp. C8-1-8 TaxID=2698831 RepID=UPI00136DD04D|nr:hypothetical protein [Clostridium sp. C8-1-8]